MENKFEVLQKLFQDAESAKKLLSSSPEEVAAMLKEQHGLDFTIEELEEVARGIVAGLKEESDDELSSEDLENVVGGAKSGAYYAGYYIGKVVQVAGVALGIAGTLVAIGAVSW